MSEISKVEQQKIVRNERLNAVTYGLFYPAFFGNMVYDLILNIDKVLKGKPDNGLPQSTFTVHLLCEFLIVIFYVVDYIHLYVDMNEIVPKKRRSISYLICDLATPLFFFLGFVFLKLGVEYLSCLCICLIPPTILRYKRNNKKNTPSINFFKYLTIAGAICMTIFYVIVGFSLTDRLFSSIILLAVITGLLTFYMYYVFGYYQDKPKALDMQFINETDQDL